MTDDLDPGDEPEYDPSNLEADVRSDENVWDLARRRIVCSEPLKELTTFVDSMGRAHHRLQCPECGGWSGVSRSSSPTIPFNHSLQDQWQAKVSNYAKAVFNGRRAKSLTKFRDEAQWLLGTQTWQAFRKLVFARDGGVCQGCLVAPATEVHHMNYDREFGQEMMFDLISVCRSCHEKITNKIGIREVR